MQEIDFSYTLSPDSKAEQDSYALAAIAAIDSADTANKLRDAREITVEVISLFSDRDDDGVLDGSLLDVLEAFIRYTDMDRTALLGWNTPAGVNVQVMTPMSKLLIFNLRSDYVITPEVFDAVKLGQELEDLIPSDTDYSITLKAKVGEQDTSYTLVEQHFPGNTGPAYSEHGNGFVKDVKQLMTIYPEYNGDITQAMDDSVVVNEITSILIGNSDALTDPAEKIKSLLEDRGYSPASYPSIIDSYYTKFQGLDVGSASANIVSDLKSKLQGLASGISPQDGSQHFSEVPGEINTSAWSVVSGALKTAGQVGLQVLSYAGGAVGLIANAAVNIAKPVIEAVSAATRATSPSLNALATTSYYGDPLFQVSLSAADAAEWYPDMYTTCMQFGTVKYSYNGLVDIWAWVDAQGSFFLEGLLVVHTGLPKICDPDFSVSSFIASPFTFSRSGNIPSSLANCHPFRIAQDSTNENKFHVRMDSCAPVGYWPVDDESTAYANDFVIPTYFSSDAGNMYFPPRNAYIDSDQKPRLWNSRYVIRELYNHGAAPATYSTLSQLTEDQVYQAVRDSLFWAVWTNGLIPWDWNSVRSVYENTEDNLPPMAGYPGATPMFLTANGNVNENYWWTGGFYCTYGDPNYDMDHAITAISGTISGAFERLIKGDLDVVADIRNSLSSVFVPDDTIWKGPDSSNIYRMRAYLPGPYDEPNYNPPRYSVLQSTQGQLDYRTAGDIRVCPPPGSRSSAGDLVNGILFVPGVNIKSRDSWLATKPTWDKAALITGVVAVATVATAAVVAGAVVKKKIKTKLAIKTQKAYNAQQAAAKNFAAAPTASNLKKLKKAQRATNHYARLSGFTPLTAAGTNPQQSIATFANSTAQEEPSLKDNLAWAGITVR